MTDGDRGSGRGVVRLPAVLTAALLAAVALTAFTFISTAAPVAITVPYSASGVADADLDGNPGTGAWADALSAAIPLENGASPPYGSATLYAKHDGTFMYFRIDGSIDVAWVSAAGNHFWLGMQVSPSSTSHHSGGTWDGTFFGLWDGTDYAPQPVYPPSPVDTNGFQKPPAKDASQDAVGRMAYSGSVAPYAFTAEWKKRLSTGDASDIAYAANGATTYNFFVTTDSDGRGSQGGGIDHSSVTNANTMKFAPPVVANAPPQVDLTTPDGGERWTGGSAHRIWWNMSDAETAVASLRVWINYSADGVSFAPIAGAQGASGFSNPCSFLWTLPLDSTSAARVRVTVVDGNGASASDASAAPFTIDSTAPTVVSFTPADGTMNVSASTQVRVLFSEPMNQASANAAFSLRRMDSGAYVAGAIAWSGNELVFTPSAALAEGIVYRAQVNATARDASVPGNALPSVRTASFTTGDTTAPTIANPSAAPSPQEAGGRVNVSAAVTDNGALSSVWIEVRDPGGALLGNRSARYDPGSGRYFDEAPYATPGTYAVRIAAVDAAGNWAVATYAFSVVDTTPPSIAHTPVTDMTTGSTARLLAQVQDADAVAEVRVDFTDVLGVRTNATMVRNGSFYEYDLPAQSQAGTLTYFVWAADPSGNAARTPEYGVTVIDVDDRPPVISAVAANPAVQDSGFSVNLTATVTDNVGLARVHVAIRDPAGATVGNVTMTRAGLSPTFYHVGLFPALGAYAFTVWAEDTSGLWASAPGSFEILDRLAPAIDSVASIPGVQESGQAVNVTARISDNVGVASARILVRDPLGAVVLDAPLEAASGVYWKEVVPGAPGNYSYTVLASDASGNAASVDGGFRAVDTQAPVAVPGPDRSVWIGSTVVFNASASSDNSAIVNVSWSFAYNGSTVVLYGGEVPFTFDVAGEYVVTLRVVDMAGLEGTAQVSITVLTDTTPPPSPNVVGIAAVAPACLAIAWEPSGAADVAGYRLYRWNHTRSNFDLIANLSADVTSFTDCGLEDDTVYSYWVVAFDGYGNISPPSPIANGRTLGTEASSSDLEWLYQTVIAVLVLLLVVVGVLWATGRKKDRPRPPGTL